MWESIAFWLLATATVACALCVVLHKNPIISAFFLVGSFFTLAGLYLILNAPFLAAIQIIVYAGAIMVLFVFVMMLLNLQKDPERFSHASRPRWAKYLALLILIGILVNLIFVTAFPMVLSQPAKGFTVNQIASLLFSKYLFPFELASFLLLIAIVGGVILAKKKI